MVFTATSFGTGHRSLTAKGSGTLKHDLLVRLFLNVMYRPEQAERSSGRKLILAGTALRLFRPTI
jgi:hypothetical protein